MLSDMQIKVKPYKLQQKACTITYWVICVGQSRVWTHNLELQQEEATLAMQIPARYKNISGQDASGWNINQRNWWFLQGTLLQVYLNDIEILRKRNFSITVICWHLPDPMNAFALTACFLPPSRVTLVLKGGSVQTTPREKKSFYCPK